MIIKTGLNNMSHFAHLIKKPFIKFKYNIKIFLEYYFELNSKHLNIIKNLLTAYRLTK